MKERKMVDRPTWDEYFLAMVDLVGSRATCDRGRSGCVIVRDNRMLVSGYVGAPAGVDHCDEVGHELHTVTNSDGTESTHCIRTTHAEQNALVNAARDGIAVKGSTLYCRMEPCYTCAKLIINAGITRVVARKKYHRAQRSREIFAAAGVELVVWEDSEEDYPDK